MTTSVTVSPNYGTLQGHCSHCHKVWTLETAQGICRWCGQPSSCQTTRTNALRSLKSSRSHRRTQVVKGNGYDHLEGQWLTYYQVAVQFSHRALPADRDDLLHDIIVTLADVERNNGHKPPCQARGKLFTEAVMYRIASRTVALYWRNQYKLTNGLTCGNCSQKQRAKCRAEWSYSQCPKAIKLESLNEPITDSDGNVTDLGDLIADDKAVDLAEWLDAKSFLARCPHRLISIAVKLRDDETLTHYERNYLWRFRQRSQISLS